MYWVPSKLSRILGRQTSGVETSISVESQLSREWATPHKAILLVTTKQGGPYSSRRFEI